MTAGTRAGLAGAVGLLAGKIVSNTKWYGAQVAAAAAAAAAQTPGAAPPRAPPTAKAVQYGVAFGAGYLVHRLTEGKGEAK
jgi:pantothenate kinase type III